MWKDWLLPVLNLLGFASQIAIVPAVGNQKAVSDSFFTVLTPDSGAFLIWIGIYVLQSLFVLYSFLPAGRKNEVVVRGVGVWFALNAFASAIWLVVWGQRWVWAAFATLVATWCFLAIANTNMLRWKQKTLKSPSDWYRADFWLVQVPMGLTFGWVTGAAVLNLNACIVSVSRESMAVELATAVISLVFLALATFFMTVTTAWSNVTFAVSVVWYLSWASYSLSTPNVLYPNWVNYETRQALCIIAAVNAGLCGFLLFFGMAKDAAKALGLTSDTLDKKRDGRWVEDTTESTPNRGQASPLRTAYGIKGAASRSPVIEQNAVVDEL